MLKLILSSSFLEPWIAFRDLPPLKPDVPVALQPIGKESMNDLSSKIYNMMDSMLTSLCDRPTASTRSSWTTQEYFECLVYQAARNLACEGQPFASTFDRKNLKNESGRSKAIHRIRGLIMLVANVTINYTSMTLSNAIWRIEEIRPAKNPDLSPIPEIRVKYQLDNMDMNDLREKALDSERHEKNEKEWLIGLIIGRQGLAPKDTDGDELKIKIERDDALVAKRAGEGIDRDDASKWARTV